MSFLDSIFGSKSKRSMPEWEPRRKALIETTYNDIKSELGRGQKDDKFGFTFWDICAGDLDLDFVDEDECAQLSNRNPKFAGTPKERSPRKDVSEQEKFYIIATSDKMITAVADLVNGLAYQRANVS